MPTQHNLMADSTRFPSGLERSPGPCSPSNGGGRKQKQLLKPWLIEQVNSGLYPGVSWIDKDQGKFRIPWKHCGRSDWFKEDGTLYKAWAIHKGFYKENVGEHDWPTWKTRLRCALNKMKPEIVWLEDESNLDDIEDPYRVYQVNSMNGAGSASPPPQQQQQQQPPPQFLPYQQQQHTPMSLYSEEASASGSPAPLCVSPRPSSVFTAGNIPRVVSDLPVSVADQLQDDAPVDSLGSSLGQLKTEDLVKDDLDLNQYMQGGNSMESCVNFVSPPQSMETDSLKDSLKDAGYHELANLLQSADIPPHVKTEPGCLQPYIHPHEMSLTVRLRDCVLHRTLVSKPQGCRVFHGDAIPPQLWVQELFGDPGADQVNIPDLSADVCDRDARKYLKILIALHLGVDLFVREGDIYLTRRCQASIFTAPANKTDKKTIKIDRWKNPEKIFDFNNDFLPAFALYAQGQGPRPSPLVVFAIGQTFRADDSNPYGSLILSVTVRHSLASRMLEENVPDMQSLHISHSNEYDHFAASVMVSCSTDGVPTTQQ